MLLFLGPDVTGTKESTIKPRGGDMAKRRTVRHLLFIAAAMAVALGTANAAGQGTGGPGGAAALHPPVSWSTPDGTLQITLPPGWEANPRLAEDNQVIGFLNPTGMQPGQDLPMWILIELRPRSAQISFEDHVRGCLIEGASYGFVVRDSTKITTADGRALRDYTFQPSPEGSERALGFLGTATGSLLFRRQAVSTSIWEKNLPAVEMILRSVRFLPGEAKPESPEKSKTEPKKPEEKPKEKPKG